MTYVDDAFAKLQSTLEITPTEINFASTKHHQIREHISSTWTLEDHFLTGSYRRHTKTKRLKDVDLFVVVDREGPEGALREEQPTRILAELAALLRQRYDEVAVDGFACTVRFGPEDEVASFEVVPAFKRPRSGWEIPDATRGRWIATNPKRHDEASTAKNNECDAKYKPFVKMIKAINREADEPISPAFLLEVMALAVVKPPFGRYQDEIRWFLATAAERISEDWPDPAGLGPDVNSEMTAIQRVAAAEVLAGWLAVAEEAVALEDDGQERAAVESWRRLFGSRMPRP